MKNEFYRKCLELFRDKFLPCISQIKSKIHKNVTTFPMPSPHRQIKQRASFALSLRGAHLSYDARLLKERWANALVHISRAHISALFNLRPLVGVCDPEVPRPACFYSPAPQSGAKWTTLTCEALIFDESVMLRPLGGIVER